LNEHDERAKILSWTTNKANIQWYLHSPNQICEQIVENPREDSNASYNIPWTGRVINKGG